MVDFDDIQVRKRLADASRKGVEGLQRALGQVPQTQLKRVLDGASLGLLAKAINLDALIWADDPQVLMLVDHGMDPNSILREDNRVTTLLGKACSSGSETLVAGLLERGADPNLVASPNSPAPLALCALRASRDQSLVARLCAVLLSHGADGGDGMDNLDQHPLLKMAAYDALDGALVLVNHGVRGFASNGETVFDRVRQWLPGHPAEQERHSRWLGRMEAAVTELQLETRTPGARAAGKAARL